MYTKLYQLQHKWKDSNFEIEFYNLVGITL